MELRTDSQPLKVEVTQPIPTAKPGWEHHISDIGGLVGLVAGVVGLYLSIYNFREKQKEDKNREYENDYRNVAEGRYSGKRLVNSIVKILNHGDSLSSMDFSNQHFENVNIFRNIDLFGTNFSKSDLNQCDLSGSDLSRSNMKEVTAQAAKFRYSTLVKANLVKSYFRDADFTGANLIGVTAKYACFVSANLSRTQLSEADLSKASFWMANLSGSDLIGAKLVEANLYEADLQNAQCFLANFEGAQIGKAKLMGVDLSSSIGLTQEQLNVSYGDISTRIPGNSGLSRPKHWNTSLEEQDSSVNKKL